MKNITETNLQPIKPAGVWPRAWASIIDGLILGIPSLAILSLIYIFYPSIIVNAEIEQVASGATSIKSAPNYLGNAILTLFFFILSFSYSVFLTVKKGATLGKDAYGLRVVKYKTSQYVNYRTAIIRELVKGIPGIKSIPIVGLLISLIISLIDVFLILFTKGKRLIHDRIAGTQVIKAKHPWSISKQLSILLPIFIIFLISLFFYNWAMTRWSNTNIFNKSRSSTDIFSTLTDLNNVRGQFDRANNTTRRSNINAILNAVNQYSAENKGEIPNVISTVPLGITSSSGVDLCKFLVPNYMLALPVDPTLATLQKYSSVSDCKKPYSIGYTIFRDSSTNKITVGAPYAKLGEKIEVTR